MVMAGGTPADEREVITRLLLKAGLDGQWYRHASTACLALGGGIFLLAYGRWWGFAALLFGALEGAIAVAQRRAGVVVTAPAPKRRLVLFRGDPVGAALFAGVIGVAMALASWSFENDPRIPVVPVALAVVSTVAAARFAYRRGVEGYMGFVFLVASGSMIFLALR